MATQYNNNKYTIKLSIERNKNGAIVKGTRTLNPQNQSYNPDWLEVNNPVAMNVKVNNLIEAYQPLITDTITGYSVVTEYGGGKVTVTASAGSEDWQGIEDVKLINSYTDGENSIKETITRAATNQTADQMRIFAVRNSQAMGDDINAISGYFTGSTVRSAWENE